MVLIFCRYVRQAGGLCIIDEVQTGFGRAGDYFWVFETQGELDQRREEKKKLMFIIHFYHNYRCCTRYSDYG